MLFQLFSTFFKIGAFTIGGGYAMLPVIQKEIVDKKQWLTTEEFLDSIAVTNSLPGPLATNCATFVGYKLAGFLGAAVCILGAAAPSLIIILIIAAIFTSFADNPVVEFIFAGVRPAVVALVFYALIKLAKSVGFAKINVAIALASLLLIVFVDLHPAIVIILFAAVGFFLLRKEAVK